MRRALLALAFLAATFAARAQELPAEPGFVWDPGDTLYEETRSAIGAAAEKAARTSGQKVLVVASRPKSYGDADEFVASATAAWPDRTILFALRSDWTVRLAPSAAARPMLGDEAIATFQKRIDRRFTDADFGRSIVNVLADLGETLAGRPPKPWVDWKHPLYVLGGGQDAKPAPAIAGVGVGAGILLAIFLFLRALWRNPKRVLAEIAADGAQIVIGGLLDAAFGGGGGGGSSGGGSSFSGGGGSSGGGGANGSW